MTDGKFGQCCLHYGQFYLEIQPPNSSSRENEYSHRKRFLASLLKRITESYSVCLHHDHSRERLVLERETDLAFSSRSVTRRSADERVEVSNGKLVDEAVLYITCTVA